MATNETINQLPTASTIDPVNDVLPIYQNSTVSTLGINRNTFLGLSSTPVGLTDTQTLTSKTLTSPTINGATLSGTLSGTYTIGGTPTFPSSVVTLTGSQTLTNKVLTSPTINSPTITNATYSGDTIVGYTSATSGTVYGMSVVSGVLASSALVNTVNTAALQTNAVGASNLATSAITLGFAQITANVSSTSTSATYVTGLGVLVTIPAGNRKVEITFFSPSAGNVSNTNGATFTIWSGNTVGTLTTQLAQANQIPSSSGVPNDFVICQAIQTPAAGSIAYSIAQTVLVSGTSTIAAAPTTPAFIIVKAI